MYCDVREEDKDGTSEDWTEEKLKDVVDKKHAESNKRKTKTEIVSLRDSFKNYILISLVEKLHLAVYFIELSNLNLSPFL